MFGRMRKTNAVKSGNAIRQPVRNKEDGDRAALALWVKRKEAEGRETKRYWNIVLRSNFVGFTFLLLIASTYYYMQLLNDLPRDYPYLWIATLVMAPALAYCPIRTFLTEPDRLFLLPMEERLGPYFRAALRRSLLIQAGWTAALLLAVWPLYRHCEGAAAQPLWLILGLLLLAKAAGLLSAWQESRFASGRGRAASAVVRWGAAAALIPLALGQGAVWGALLLLAAALAWPAALRAARRHGVGWEALIQRETAARRRLFRFFSMFIDVPQLPASVKRRAYAASLTRLYRFAPESAHLFLFTKTGVRSDLFAMIARVTLIALVVAVVVPSDGARMAAFVIAAAISAAQLATLRDAHRYTFWLRMYPVPLARQVDAVLRIMVGALAAQTIVFTIALLLLASSPVSAVAPLLALGLIALYANIRLRRTWLRQMADKEGAV